MEVQESLMGNVLSKKISYIFVLLGFLGFLALIPGAFDNVVYTYFRVVDGSTIEFDGRCLEVPVGWVIDSTGNHGDHELVNLRKKIETGYLFASVIDGSTSVIPDYENKRPIKEMPGQFSIYELQRLPAENSVRYWSVISDQNILLMGRDIDTLAELSSVTWPVDCW